LKKPAALIAVLVLAAVAALGLASCGGGDDTSGGGQKGGNLNGTYASFPDYMDPALSYTAEGWTAMADVYTPLLTYKHANGEEGSEVIPGLAKELPKIS
jgi:peptide/nickel transport system substrate-binding protein